jgi:hypothetical protein
MPKEEWERMPFYERARIKREWERKERELDEAVDAIWREEEAARLAGERATVDTSV